MQSATASSVVEGRCRARDQIIVDVDAIERRDPVLAERRIVARSIVSPAVSKAPSPPSPSPGSRRRPSFRGPASRGGARTRELVHAPEHLHELLCGRLALCRRGSQNASKYTASLLPAPNMGRSPSRLRPTCRCAICGIHPRPNLFDPESRTSHLVHLPRRIVMAQSPLAALKAKFESKKARRGARSSRSRMTSGSAAASTRARASPTSRMQKLLRLHATFTA